jgi:hypothetical protein
MKSMRGLGNVYQPTFRARNGKLKHTSRWWIVYHVDGRRIAENAHSINRTDAVRLLKRKISDAAAGKPVGAEVDRTTLDDLVAMVEADYRANSRRSLNRIQAAGTHLRTFFGGDRKARDITADLITRYAAQRIEEGARGSTANYEMATLRRGPAGLPGREGCGAPGNQHVACRQRAQGFFEPEHFRSVLQCLASHLQPFAQVAYITGWRKGELLSRQ